MQHLQVRPHLWRQLQRDRGLPLLLQVTPPLLSFSRPEAGEELETPPGCLSRASLEFLKQTNRQPHVIHLHEWQTSACAMLYWDLFHTNGIPKPRIMLTIHSMANSGEVRQDEFMAAGIHGRVTPILSAESLLWSDG